MSYVIAGTRIANEYLALGILGAYGGLAYAATRGGGDKATAPSSSGSAAKVDEPPIDASSSDEEAFIKQFLAEAEGGDNKERLV